MPTCPSLAVFPDLIQPELGGCVLVDPTRSADPDREARFPELPYMTPRLAYFGEYFEADIGLASVRWNIVGVLSRRVFCTSRRRSRGFIPVWLLICLMAVNYPAMRARLHAPSFTFRSSYSGVARAQSGARGACDSLTPSQFPFG